VLILFTVKSRWIFSFGILLALMILSFSIVSCVSSNEQTHNLKIIADTGGTIPGGIDKLINGDYKKGTIISIEARPMPDYYFVNWTSSNGGKFADKNNSQTKFTMPRYDTTITAHFASITEKP
jgi:uncharacterized repeat protein (TIGR02543 family)